ncbi:hypothetical protein [Scleromatobacter humisilvae]|uniref:Uncharacterized protein n=1 Tax=Scleromatobacter humisilvae TaxID=2897159 RepID=A0A9X1YJ78_9BURK|nr:hypothetical protein [Scleromatobacter humisilvae]MCK9685870.1 hypothetical protein [Scleromatobacter humisilvae]
MADATVVDPSSEEVVELVDVPPFDGEVSVVLASLLVVVLVVPADVDAPLSPEMPVTVPVSVFVPVPLATVPAALLLPEIDVDDACVGSSPLPPPPPHALTSALVASATAEPRTVSKKFKAIWSAEVGKGRSQSSSTANPVDTCCDALSIGKPREVSE